MSVPFARARELFHEPDFIRLWSVGGLTNTMRWMEILVVGVYSYQLSGSAIVVALMLFARMCPYFLFGAFVGAVVERLDRRKVLIIALAVSAMSAVALGTLASVGVIELWHIAIGAFLNGVFWCLEYPTRRTLLGEIAGVERVGAAMGFDSTSIQATRMLGPALGGLLFEHYALIGPYFFGVLCYVLALVNVVRLSLRHSSEQRSRQGVLTILKEGFRYLRSNRLVAGTLVVTVVVNFFGFSYGTMLPVIGGDKFALSAFPIGVMASMEGLGAMLGGLTIAVLSRPAIFTRIYVFGSFVFLAMITAFSVAPDFFFSLPILLLGGLGIAGFASMQAALTFSATAPGMRRRVMGVLVVCIGAGPLGVMHTGVLAELLGADVAIRVIAIEGIFALLGCVWLWPELLRPTSFPASSS